MKASSSKPSAEAVEVQPQVTTDPSAGKSTLTGAVRGLDAPAGAAPSATANASRGELMFGSTKRGLHAGAPEPGRAYRGNNPAAGAAEPDGADGAHHGASGHGAPHAAAVTISSHNTGGPTFGPGGAALWHVAFSTTGRTGWIVQRIDNTVAGTGKHGRHLTPADLQLTAHYFEAWSVDAQGAVTPIDGGDNDRWDQGPVGEGTKGTWTTNASLHWVAGAARPAGMAPGAVPSAGILVSSTAAPPHLGPALLHRFARGTWDSTVTPATDHGTAS